MAYMAQPSFPVATDSSGHHFYPASSRYGNPLNDRQGATQSLSSRSGRRR